MRLAWLKDLRLEDLAEVGGKNASLGEMIGALAAAGKEIRSWILDTPFPAPLAQEIREHYQQLERQSGGKTSFAVRSSATAEDLPEASFAGQQETFLNISGADNVLEAIRRVFASLYNDRAISYRVHQGFAHGAVALSAAVQQMVRSDLGASGVLFTLDTESGFRDVVFITSSFGLGEMVVQGAVNPDEFYVHKPLLERGKPAIVRRALGSKLQKMVFSQSAATGKSTRVVDVPEAERHRFSLSDQEILELARYALTIERHYGRPMDIEWGKDGADGRIYVLQARPETVKSRKRDVEERYALKGSSRVLVSGRAIGSKIGSGTVRVIADASKMSRVKEGDILVTDMTDPNWEPVMKLAAAIITNRGGRTCHAAIIARELGIPAVVGCGDATQRLKDGQQVTVSCAEGDTGSVFDGLLPFEVSSRERGEMPRIPVKIAMNVGNPQLAFEFAQLPNAGVGLARLEFIINNEIGVHPRACLDYPKLEGTLKRKVEEKARGYADPRTFFVEKMVEGVATIAAAFWPKPVIVRLSDFKSNEYRKLLGGERYEPDEENPMLGFRGAARYIAPSFRECFELECLALRKVRETLGLTNVELMVPFVRTVGEARAVLELLDKNGLKRGQNGLRIVMMCELPSNAVLAEQFLELFDGFSIGSNDLTQLTLGLDRDSGLVAEGFDERDEI